MAVLVRRSKETERQIRVLLGLEPAEADATPAPRGAEEPEPPAQGLGG